MKETKRDSFLLPVNFEMKKRVGLLVAAAVFMVLENILYAHFFGWLMFEENVLKLLLVLLVMIVLDIYLVSAVKRGWNWLFRYRMKRVD